MVYAPLILSIKNSSIRQKINKFNNLRPPSCSDGPFSSWLTQKCSKEGKKVSQYQAFLVTTIISGLWPKKWVFCPEHKNGTTDFTYFDVFYHISSNEPSGVRGETGKWIYFEHPKNHIWLISTKQINRFQKFLFLGITHALYHNGPQ